MTNFTFVNVSQLFYYDDDEYFLLISFLNTPPCDQYNFFGANVLRACSNVLRSCIKKWIKISFPISSQTNGFGVMVIGGVNDLHKVPITSIDRLLLSASSLLE